MPDRIQLSEAFVALTAEDRGLSAAFAQWERRTADLAARFSGLVGAVLSFEAIRRAVVATTGAAESFNQKMLGVANTLGARSIGGIQDLREEIKRLSDDTGFAANEIASAFAEINVAADDNPAATLDAMRDSARLALAAMLPLKDTVSLMSDITDAWDIDGSGLRQMTEQIFTAKRFGEGGFQPFLTSLAGVAPTAAAAGIGPDQVMAAMMAGTRGGWSPDRTAGALRQFINGFMKSADDISDSPQTQMKAMVREAAQRDLVGTLARLPELGAGLIGGAAPGRDTIALADVMQRKYADAVEIRNALQRRSNALDEAAARATDSYTFRLKRLRESITNLSSSIGDVLLPIVSAATERAVGVLQPMRQWIDRNGELVRSLAIAGGSILTLLVGTKVLGATLAITRGAVVALASPFNSLIILGLALGGAWVAARVEGKTLSERIGNLGKAAGGWIQQARAWIDAHTGLVKAMGMTVGAVASAIVLFRSGSVVVGGLVGAFRIMSAIAAAMATPLGGLLLLVGSLAGAFMLAQFEGETMGDRLGKVAEFLQERWAAFRDSMGEIMISVGAIMASLPAIFDNAANTIEDRLLLLSGDLRHFFVETVPAYIKQTIVGANTSLGVVADEAGSAATDAQDMIGALWNQAAAAMEGDFEEAERQRQNLTNSSIRYRARASGKTPEEIYTHDDQVARFGAGSREKDPEAPKQLIPTIQLFPSKESQFPLFLEAFKNGVSLSQLQATREGAGAGPPSGPPKDARPPAGPAFVAPPRIYTPEEEAARKRVSEQNTSLAESVGNAEAEIRGLVESLKPKPKFDPRTGFGQQNILFPLDQEAWEQRVQGRATGDDGDDGDDAMRLAGDESPQSKFSSEFVSADELARRIQGAALEAMDPNHETAKNTASMAKSLAAMRGVLEDIKTSAGKIERMDLSAVGP